MVRKSNVVTETKFLGVILDHKLTFKNHIDYISNKIAKCIDYIQSKKSIINLFLENVVYGSSPTLDLFYCVEIWGHTWCICTLRSSPYCRNVLCALIITFSRLWWPHLTIIQISEISYLSGSNMNSKVATLVFREFTKCIARIRLLTISLPIYHQDMLDHLQPPFCSHKLCEFSVRVMGPRIWNRIKKELKCCKTIGNFKRLYKINIISTPSNHTPISIQWFIVNEPKGLSKGIFVFSIFY